MRATRVIHPRLLLILGFTTLWLAACGITNTSRIMTGQAGSPHEGPVQVIMQGSPTPSHFVEVAVVQAIGHGLHADLEHTIEGLKQEARRLGCHAIINVKVDQGSGTASATGICVRRFNAAPTP